MRRDGFTLIELIVATTLSAGLFLALSGFLGSGMSSVYQSEKAAKERLSGARATDALERLGKDPGLVSMPVANLPANVSTGMLFRSSDSDYPYVFVGEETDYDYCRSGTPVSRLVIAEGTSLGGETLSSGGYSLSGGRVYSGANVLLGAQYPGDALGSPLETELSGPSAIAASGGTVFVADTGNNRVLAYSGGTVYEVISDTDGILEPKSLAFESGSLLIWAENGLYRIRTESGDPNRLSASFEFPKDVSYDSVSFGFDGIAAPGSPSGTPDFTLPWSGSGDSVTTTGNLVTYAHSWSRSAASGSVFAFSVNAVSPAPTVPGSYVLNLRFLSGWSEIFSRGLPYFWIGESLISGSGRTIERIVSGNVRNVASVGSYKTGAVDLSAFLTASESVSKSESVMENLRFEAAWKAVFLRYVHYGTYDCQNGNHVKKERTTVLFVP